MTVRAGIILRWPYQVCVDGKWKIDEHNIHITHVITHKYFSDISKDLWCVDASIKKITEDPYADKIMLSLLNTTRHAKLDIIDKIQGGFCSKLKDVFVSELYDEQFHKLVDADLDLIGFNNGIYNIKTQEFFPSSKEYFVTKTVGYDYDVSNFEFNDDT